MADITLIGTNHGDPTGPSSLEKALRSETPDIITVESGPLLAQAVISGTLKKSMIRQLKKARKYGLREDVYEAIVAFTKKNHSYEIVTSKRYATESGIPIHYIDHPETDRGPLEAANRPVRRESVGNMNSFSIDRFADEANFWYEHTRRAFDDPEHAQQILDRYSALLIPQLDRDEVPAGHVRRLIQDFPAAKVVHVGGCIHLLDDKKRRTLYSKIKELNPTRKVLRDY